MDNEQIISVLERVMDDLRKCAGLSIDRGASRGAPLVGGEDWQKRERYRLQSLHQLQHLITSLSEPGAEANPVTDEESIPF